jgi:hypothetical protein
MRPAGNSKPELTSAARTRSLAFFDLGGRQADDVEARQARTEMNLGVDPGCGKTDLRAAEDARDRHGCAVSCATGRWRHPARRA